MGSPSGRRMQPFPDRRHATGDHGDLRPRPILVGFKRAGEIAGGGSGSATRPYLEVCSCSMAALVSPLQTNGMTASASSMA